MLFRFSPRLIAALAGLVLAAALVPAVGCGGGSTATGGSGGGTGGIGGSTDIAECESDSRAMTYSSNLTEDGKNKTFQIQILSAAPAPPARNDNTWRFKVLDAGGKEVKSATVTVTPYMPDHKHGTQIIATVTPESDGSYTVEPLDLFMPGLWTITFDIDSAGTKDSVVFGFCIQG